MEFIMRKLFGKSKGEKNFIEVVFGHYKKGDTSYGDKLYIIDKYLKGTEERTNKAIGLTREQAEFVYNALGEYLKEDK